MANNEKKQDNVVLYTLNITLRLVVICAIIALLVATVNHFTAPVIAENEKQATRAAVEELFSEGVTMEEFALDETNLVDPAVSSAAKVYDGETLLGYYVKLAPDCFKGKVDLIVSLDGDAFITGVKIVSTNDETSGIGTKVQNADFTDQFIGLSSPIDETDYHDYTISGATKTSKPVTAAISAAIAEIDLLTGIGTETEGPENE